MDDNREGCFPESYVHPADSVSTEESVVPQPVADDSKIVSTLVLNFAEYYFCGY